MLWLVFIFQLKAQVLNTDDLVNIDALKARYKIRENYSPVINVVGDAGIHIGW